MTQEEYNKLTDKLIKYSEAYYNDDKSLITDREFDELLVESQYMEKKHPEWIRKDSVTQAAGIATNGDKTKHDRKMLSLGNTYNKEEIQEWYNKMVLEGAKEFIVEYKYDGVSFSAKYENGKLVKGVSRGDGEYGLDMTLNMRMIDDLQLPEDSTFSGEVRGEIMMSKAEFNRLNDGLAEDDKHANPRNLASGTLKLLDIERIKKRKLIAFTYWLENSPFEHYDSMASLQRIGFNVGPMFRAINFDILWDTIVEIEKMKPDLSFEIDGAVIKVNDSSLWKKIGFTSKFPKWAKAYKYEPESIVTRVNSITYQVGRTGKITPVAELEPVLLSGSTVARVTLNNKAYMKDMDIMIGDYVDVKKAAEIIPFIKEVLVERRDIDGEPRTASPFPTICPKCGTKLVKQNKDQQDYFCTNDDCGARIVGKLVKYTTDMEIDGFAEVLVDRLYSAGFLCSIPDLYKLKNFKHLMADLDRMGTKLVTRLLKNIEDSKTQKLVNFVHGIGIKNVGNNTSKLLVKNFGTMKLIMGATKEELIEIEDIGEIVANSIYTYFRDPDNKVMIQGLLDIMDLEEPIIEDKGDLLKLDGKNFCITGALSLKRDDYVELLENMGAKVVSGVSKKTHYLITNATTRTTKYIKAETLGIPILTEMELLEMCDSLHLLKRLTV